ncbi:MAG: PLP-dependent aspartate aminotransferase family protein [Anaerolineae bacterium]|nr:PLP-dependent aspartate aminotransferase family protein [Anaerolineae bacterium]MDQ7037378.1 PLP-dependent aspartate aminotransferase family protein [Anaerolineae bacterium]
MKIETEAIHSGYDVDSATGALTAPIHLSTTFERDADGEYSRDYVYTRSENPNRSELESRLTTLENGFETAAFASGSVAMMSILQALQTGDHILAPDNLYFGIKVIMTDIFAAWGLETVFVDMTNLDTVKAAMKANTRLVIIETPSNPLIKVTDIQAVANIAHDNDAYLVCDNTIPTPVFQKPLELGADFVVHATTKYIAGHSDALGGAVIAKEECALWQRLRVIQKVGGAVPSPFDCWLILRGLQTLPIRAKAHAENALTVAHFLENHSKVEAVLYAGLESHAQHTIAKKQMTGFGGLLSFLVQGGQNKAMAMTTHLHLIKRATSFGGTHSTIEHRASVEQGTSTPQNLLRLSVGIEHSDDIIADLAQALDAI